MSDTELKDGLTNKYRVILIKYANFMNGRDEDQPTTEELTKLRALEVILRDLKETKKDGH